MHSTFSLARNERGEWTVNIEHATLDGLKDHIRGVHKTPTLENDGPKLSMLNDSGKFSPRNDQGLHWSFRRCVGRRLLSGRPISVYY
ncbi:unnamed protein product [Rhizophagus irregularis]|nr:unnamed protein product [Rhizophagus irregularis]